MHDLSQWFLNVFSYYTTINFKNEAYATDTEIYIYVYMYTYTYVCMRIHICMYTYTFIRICIIIYKLHVVLFKCL